MLASAGVSAHGASAIRAVALLQVPDMINSGNSKLLEFFVGLVALAMVVQAIVVVALAVGLMKAQKELMGHVNEIRGKLTPLINKSHILVNDLAPEIKQITTKVNDLTGKASELTSKINVITAHVEQMVGVAKDKVEEFSPTISAANETVVQANETVRIANRKTREQVERVNGMVTSTLNATVKLGKAVEQGLSVPRRELAGIIAGVRASVDVLVDRAKNPVRPRVVPGRGPVAPRPAVSEAAARISAFRTMADAPYSYTEPERDLDR